MYEFCIALGYEDLNDHDELRHDPVMSVLASKLEASRSDCAPVAAKSTLNRLELSRDKPTKYAKIAHDPAAIEGKRVAGTVLAERGARVIAVGHGYQHLCLRLCVGLL